MRRLAQPVLRRVGSYAANSTVDQLLFRETVQDIAGTHSLIPMNVRRMAQIYVGFEAAEFYCRHLYNAKYYPNYLDHVSSMAARAAASGPGTILEFGVSIGTTIRAIAGAIGQRDVVGFDSFKGLPENWLDGVEAGSFASDIPTVPDNARLVIGMIEDTLPTFLASMKERQIRFIHIDTDLYGPAKTVLSLCQPFMQETIIVFDEFYNYPGWRDHEFKAFTEFQREHEGTFKFEYIGLGGQVAVSARLLRR